jgi:hypothetical protein
MASEQVLDVLVRRHIINSERPFSSVLDGIFAGITRPDIGPLYLQLDLDAALALDPRARAQAGRRLVRLIAGNPVTMGQMTRHVPDAGSYAPVTILVQEMSGGSQVAYDAVASALAPYHDAAASQVARRLDAEVLGLLRQVTGVPRSASP